MVYTLKLLNKRLVELTDQAGKIREIIDKSKNHKVEKDIKIALDRIKEEVVQTTIAIKLINDYQKENTKEFKFK